MTLSQQILSELNNINSLVSSELTAADVVPHIPNGKELRKTKGKTGVCCLCNRWDSDLKMGACDWCNKKYGVSK